MLCIAQLCKPRQLYRAFIWEKSWPRANNAGACSDCLKQRSGMLWLSRVDRVPRASVYFCPVRLLETRLVLIQLDNTASLRTFSLACSFPWALYCAKRLPEGSQSINNYWSGNGWAKYRDLSSVVSISIICWSRRLRQIIDLRDTDKSRYFAITEFNNCFIIRSRSLFFKEYLREAKRSAIFTQERSQEGEKRGFIYAWAE